MNKWTNVILLYRDVYTYIHAPLYISIHPYSSFFIHIHIHIHLISQHLSIPPSPLPSFPPLFKPPPLPFLPPPSSCLSSQKSNEKKSKSKQQKATKSNKKKRESTKTKPRSIESEIWPDMYVYIYQALAINYNHSYFHI